MHTQFLIRQNSVLTCIIAIFLISWGFILLLVRPGNLPIDAEKSSQLLPLLYVTMLFGPAVAGIVFTGIVRGKEGIRKLGKQLFKWRVGIHWYLIALFAVPVFAFILLLFLSRFSPEFDIGILNSEGENPSTILIGIYTGLMVGLFEEVGWSGFVIPELRMRYNIIRTGLMVGFVWGAWHFILFWEKDSFTGTLPLLTILGRLFAWLPPFRIVMVWILDRTESLLIVILTHASLVFTTTVLVPISLNGRNLGIWLLLWGVVLWILVLIIRIFDGRILTRKSNTS